MLGHGVDEEVERSRVSWSLAQSRLARGDCVMRKLDSNYEVQSTYPDYSGSSHAYLTWNEIIPSSVSDHSTDTTAEVIPYLDLDMRPMIPLHALMVKLRKG
jgi:hypothetical protein